MEKRFVTFLVLSFAVLMANAWLMNALRGPQQKPAAPAPAAPAPAGQPAPDKAAGEPAPKPQEEKAAQDGAAPAQPDAIGHAAAIGPAAAPMPPADEPAQQYLALGSASASSGYRMLVVFNNRGACVDSIELSSPRIRDLEDRSGYLGYLAESDVTGAADKTGCLVGVVGAGTPAEAAGLKAGDILTKAGGEVIKSARDLHRVLHTTKPGERIELAVERQGGQQQLTTTLGRRPLRVVRVEGDDQASFLMTLERIDEAEIPKDAEELPGLRMRTGNWHVEPQQNPDELAFRWPLPEHELEIVKRFRLAKVPAEVAEDETHPAYHIELHVELRNLGQKTRRVAYRLDGPTGLPTEGWWYAKNSKISPNWRDSAGLRDMVLAYVQDGRFRHRLISCTTIVNAESQPAGQQRQDATRGLVVDNQALAYFGVDAQYFSSVLIPQPNENGPLQFAQTTPLMVGPAPAEAAKHKLTNISCRATSLVLELAAQKTLQHDYVIFTGPKKPSLLAHYAPPHGLGNLVEYGMFSSVSRVMLAILHFFYSIVRNYGLAIIMLTVVVRMCMFPLSRKQALNAQKMQELQPEIKRIAEKHKGNMELRTKAQQELFRKHRYNPLSGCLPVFIQLPIFLGLYRSLAVDVELRGAPLLTDAIRWCSNLAAPDMLWYWQPYLPAFLAGELGWLGPYFNVFPIITTGLFLWQQKMFMPPAADEQAAMQIKIMQWMTLFMCVLFFTVPSGLCVYFIASSLWGIAERKLLPKTLAAQRQAAAGGSSPQPPAAPGTNGKGSSAAQKKKERGRR